VEGVVGGGVITYTNIISRPLYAWYNTVGRREEMGHLGRSLSVSKSVIFRISAYSVESTEWVKESGTEIVSVPVYVH